MKKNSFTLFELMLVITLIAVVLGTLAIQVPKVLRTEKFERGVERVISKITLSQELMLDYRTDVILTLLQTDKGVSCDLATLQPIPPHIERALKQHQLIEGISLEEEQVTLKFDATVGATPKMLLPLKTVGRKATLVLKGFPSRITRGENFVHEQEAIYPEEILSTL